MSGDRECHAVNQPVQCCTVPVDIGSKYHRQEEAPVRHGRIATKTAAHSRTANRREIGSGIEVDVQQATHKIDLNQWTEHPCRVQV